MIAGQLEIQLLANMARLQADMREAKNTVSRTVSDLNRVLGTIGVGISFAGIAAGIGAMVRASEEAAVAQRKLDAVIRATGNTSGYTAAQLSKLADNLARTSTFDDEGFREATATLLRFGNIGGENLEKVLKLSADYAALTGGDLVSASEKLGRALSNPAEGLSKLERNFGDLGPEVKAAIDLQMKLGDQSGALGIAIEALQKKIGGADQEMNAGLTGSMKQLRKALSELMEAGGGAVDNSFVVGILDAISSRLRGIKAVMEGDWSMKLVAILGGGNVLSALGNMKPAGIIPGAVDPRLPTTTIVDEGLDSRGASLAKIELERREAARKARKEWLDEQERMRKLDAAGWVAYIEAMKREDEEGLREMAKLSEAYYANEDELRKIELEGQEALAKNVVRIVEEEEKRVAEIRRANSIALWEEISDAAGNFFADLAMNGKSAFDNLKKYLKDLIAQMLALFAKRWVLNLAAGGSLLGSAGSALAGDGGGGLAGNLLGGLTGSPLGAVVGGLGIAAALYSMFKDGPENPNFRWMQGQGGPGAFGGISTQGNYNFDGSALMQSVGSLDRRFQAILGAGGSAAATSALSGYTSAGRRMDGQPAQFAFPEGTDKEAAEQLAKELLQSRYGTLFAEVDASIADQVKNWSGDSASLETFIETMLGVIEGLGKLNITGLDLESLKAMQKEGESLDQTFQRVANTWAWFTDNFYTDAEKLDIAQKQVEKTFAELGIAVPANVTEFRKLVEGLDLSTEAGRTMFNMLMGVAPAFLQVADAATVTTEAVAETAKGITDAEREIRDANARAEVERRRAAVEAARQAAEVRKSLREYLSGLLLDESTSPLTLQQRMDEAKRQYEETLGLAKGGDLAAQRGLGNAFDAYLKLAREMFGSSAAYNAIFQQGFDEIRGVAKGGPNWQDAMAAAMPAGGAKLASSEDVAGLNTSVRELISLIAEGISVNDRRAHSTLNRLETHLRGSTSKGALASSR